MYQTILFSIVYRLSRQFEAVGPLRGALAALPSLPVPPDVGYYGKYVLLLYLSIFRAWGLAASACFNHLRSARPLYLADFSEIHQLVKPSPADISFFLDEFPVT
jgi:hypothetical protein